jgi:hypothetical protein
MATMTETPEAVSTYSTSHDYHAEANVLSGDLQRPIEAKIDPQAPLSLNDRRGGHFNRQIEDFSIEGLISFARGETRVSGARSTKNKNWVTLSTSVTEGLNVFEVITADRVVSQVSTDHAYYEGNVPQGHVPRVTFLGTQFTNLRVAGVPITPILNLGICGGLPAGGRSYLEDPDFLGRVKAQTSAIANAAGLPKELKDQYDEKLAHLDDLIRASQSGDRSSSEPITCSVVQSINVQSIDGQGTKLNIPGVQVFGNLLVIEDFGTVALGELMVRETIDKLYNRPDPYFELTGIHLKLGCLGDGTTKVATAAANGHTKP